MIVHIDCNNYYASCEIVTNPELEGRPVVVGNGNEAGGGCILALNAEAKALGIKRGTPFFQVKSLLDANKVAVCKVDFKKYKTISARIMDEVRRQEIVVGMVQYSVDEFFGSIPIDDPKELALYLQKVKQMIFSTTKIPVSCGCAETYTLAKCATYFAKHYAGYNGVCVITPEKREKALSVLPVGEVWGIGRRMGPKLSQMGVNTALDFAKMDENDVKVMLSLTGYRTYRELNGVVSIDLKRQSLQRSVMQSSTFVYMTTSKDDLHDYVRQFVVSAARNLRNQHGLCKTVTVFLSTNRHREDLAQYRNSATSRLQTPTADTLILIPEAIRLLDQLYIAGYQYKQAGVVLGDTCSDDQQQLDLFTVDADEKRRKLMAVADSINKQYGNAALNYGFVSNELPLASDNGEDEPHQY